VLVAVRRASNDPLFSGDPGAGLAGSAELVWIAELDVDVVNATALARAACGSAELARTLVGGRTHGQSGVLIVDDPGPVRVRSQEEHLLGDPARLAEFLSRLAELVVRQTGLVGRNPPRSSHASVISGWPGQGISSRCPGWRGPG